MNPLFAATAAAPESDTPRLVYADFLDEAGDGPRAEFIRLQCEAARLGEAHPDAAALEDRAHELLAQHEARWLGFDPRSTHAPLEWEFARGFLDSARLTQASLADPAVAAGLARHPVAKVDVAEDFDDSGDVTCGGPADEGLPIPPLPALRSLDVTSVPGTAMIGRLMRAGSPGLRALKFWPAGGADFTAVLRLAAEFAPGLESLAGRTGFDGGAGGAFIADFLKAAGAVRLKSFRADVAPAEFAAALKSKSLADLETLGLAFDPSGDDAGDGADEHLAALTGVLRKAHKSLRLRELAGKLSYFLKPAACAELLAVPALSELHTLDAHVGSPAADVARAIAAAPLWQHARKLDFSFYESDIDDFLAVLGRAPGGTHLRGLYLWPGVGVGAPGLASLASAPWAAGLTRLVLKLNQAGRQNAPTALGAAPLTSLRTLHLNNASSYDDGELVPVTGARALAESPNLSRLRTLTLGNFGLGTDGVEALLAGRHWSISALGFSNCGLTADAAPKLAAWPKLARLTHLDLSRNPDLGGDALLPLAESPHLSAICEVDLSRVNPSDRVREAFAARLGRRFGC